MPLLRVMRQRDLFSGKAVLVPVSRRAVVSVGPGLYRSDAWSVYMRRYRASSPERRARLIASALAGQAVRRGLLKREACKVCGSADAEMHHPDYRKPLVVDWLCKKHHSSLHVSIRAGLVPAPVAAVDDRQLSFSFMSLSV